MANLILICGVCLIVNLIGIILSLTDLNDRTPAITLGLNQVIFIPICITSLTLALVFVPPSSRSGSDRSTSMTDKVTVSTSQITLTSTASMEQDV